MYGVQESHMSLLVCWSLTETEAEAETETESRTDRVRVIARARVIVKYGFKVCPVVK